MNLRWPSRQAALARSAAWPEAEVSRTSTSSPAARIRSRAGPSSLRLRPPPAAGLMIARYFPGNSELFHRRLAVEGITNFICQFSALDFHRSGAREILIPQHTSRNPFVVWQCAVARSDIFLDGLGEILVQVRMHHQHQRFCTQLFLRPDIVGCEDAVLFDRNALEGGLDILGINILSAFGDDHIFLAAE